jgi:hypothetical protein
MNAVRDPGARRPGRVAGLLLVAIAALALVLGVITLVIGGGSTQGGGGQSSAPPPPPASTGTRPNPTTAPPPNNTSTSKPAPPTSQPPATSTTVAPPPFDPHTVPLRVLNNSTINGWAAMAADKFRKAGWNVIEVGNFPEQQGGRIVTTTAYFRPGTDEEPAAKALAAQFSMRPNERFPGIANEGPGVVVIVTNDFDSK